MGVIVGEVEIVGGSWFVLCLGFCDFFVVVNEFWLEIVFLDSYLVK